MTWLVVVLIVVAVLVVGGLLALGGRPYKALFADAHLVELCETLDRIRAAACAKIEPPAKSVSPADAVRDDPRSAVTSAGLRLHYSATEIAEAPDFVSHHVSLSHPAGLLAESASRFLAAFVMVRYSVPAAGATVRRSQNLVIHIVFQVDRAHNAAFAARVLPVPSKVDIPALRRFCGDTCDKIDYATFDVRVPPSPRTR